MSLTSALLVLGVILLSAFLQGCTGFGFSIVGMSLLPFIMPMKDAAAVTAASAIVMNAAIAVRLRKSINAKLMLYPLLTSTITSVLGIFALETVSDAVVRRILGAILILTAVFLIVFSKRIHLSASPVNGLIVGALSGFLSGLFNLGGPPMVVYFMSVTDDKLEFNATLQYYFTINGVLILFLHLLSGHFTTIVLQFSIIALAAVMVGAVLGYALFKKMTFSAIRRAINGFMVVFGIYLLIRG